MKATFTITLTGNCDHDDLIGDLAVKAARQLVVSGKVEADSVWYTSEKICEMESLVMRWIQDGKP